MKSVLVSDSRIREQMPVAPVHTSLSQLLQKELRVEDWIKSVRVTWEFWGTRTTLCSSPSSLYTETNQWPSSMKKFGRRRTSFCKSGKMLLWQLMIWNTMWVPSFFIWKLWKVWNWGSCFDVLSLQIFPKFAYIAQNDDVQFVFWMSWHPFFWNPFKCVKLADDVPQFTGLPAQGRAGQHRGWRLEIWYKPR